MRHLYYFDPETIDISKLRQCAADNAKGDSRTRPQSTTIHFHKIFDYCDGFKHEVTTLRKGQEPMLEVYGG